MKKVVIIIVILTLLFPKSLFASEAVSELPENLYGTPISSETTSDEYGNKITTYTYSDGSVTTLGVSGGDCGSNGYSTWCNGVRVELSTEVYQAHFYADYSMSSADYDINAVYDPYVYISEFEFQIVPGSIELVINVGSSSTQAYATLYWTSTISYIESYLRLYVDSSGAHATHKVDYMDSENPSYE